LIAARSCLLQARSCLEPLADFSPNWCQRSLSRQKCSIPSRIFLGELGEKLPTEHTWFVFQSASTSTLLSNLASNICLVLLARNSKEALANFRLDFKCDVHSQVYVRKTRCQIAFQKIPTCVTLVCTPPPSPPPLPLNKTIALGFLSHRSVVG